MFYRGPGFLAVVLFGSSLLPLTRSPALPLILSLPSVCRRSSLLMRGGKGVGEEKNHATTGKAVPL
jgi:hypothetical protein